MIGRMWHFLRDYFRRPSVRWSVAALLVYAVTTIVMLYPVPFRLNSVIAGEPRGDAPQYAWSLWWAKEALLDPDKDLTHLTLMNHPVGLEHPFLLTMLTVSYTALPFSLFLSPAATYNLQIILSFVLSGLTMYWLCTELTGDHQAGLVGGFIYAFFLNKTGHVLGGHLPQVRVYWVPLVALFLWRVIKQPRWHTALAAALALVLASLVHVMHLAYLVVPVAVTVLAAAWIKMKGALFTGRRLGALALMFGLAALVVGPILLSALSGSLAGESYLEEGGTVFHSTDLLAFVTPSPYHPLLGRLGLVPAFAERIFLDERFLFERLAYPGVLATGLALCGLCCAGIVTPTRPHAHTSTPPHLQPRTPTLPTWPWGVLAFVAAVLSLGPLLKVGNDLVVYQVDAHQSHVVLPYALIKEMPLVGVGRTPGRLNATALFAISILAAYGVTALASRLRQRPFLLTTLLTLSVIGIGFESIVSWPFPTTSAEVPPTMQRIADEAGDGALLHALMNRRWINHRALYYQTVAQRPIVGGEIHRTIPEAVPWSETLLGLAQPDEWAGDIVPRPTLIERQGWLRTFDIGYVIFHKLAHRDDAAYREYLEAMLGVPTYEDPTLAAFAVPPDATLGEQTRLYALGPDGWHPPDQDGDRWRRWMGDEGSVYLTSSQEEVGSLRLAVDSDAAFPILEITLGERLLDAVFVEEPRVYTTRPFTLAQGMNVLRFQARGGCPEGTQGDAVCRTFALNQIAFVPQADLGPGEGLDVSFGDQVRLRGWERGSTPLHPGDVLTMTLDWETMVELGDAGAGESQTTVVFTHLLSSDGTLVAQYDSPLAEGFPAPSDVPVGVTFRFPLAIELPSDLQAGDYRLVVGVYLWPSLERLPVLSDVPGAEAGAVELERVYITPWVSGQ
jgi:hypothetical protein